MQLFLQFFMYLWSLSCIYFMNKKPIHWSIWPSVFLCLMGGYLLTNFYSATVRIGDALVIMGAFFWSTHIIFTGKIIENYNLPLTIGAIQTIIVSSLSLFIGLVFEDFIWTNILKEKFEILYAWYFIWWSCFCFTNICSKKYFPCPCCNYVISRGGFCSLAAWILLSQVLDINNLFGCLFILFGVLFSQLAPMLKKN